MIGYSKIKVAGKRRPPSTPEECLRRAGALMKHAEQLCPVRRPRGFVFKAKTWEDYERWRRSHPNPRLW